MITYLWETDMQVIAPMRHFEAERGAGGIESRNGQVSFLFTGLRFMEGTTTVPT